MYLRQSDILKKFLEKAKSENPNFSLGLLSRKVGLSRAFLSQIVNGSRSVPFDFFHALTEALNLDPESCDLLLSSILAEKGLAITRGRVVVANTDPTRTSAVWSATADRDFTVLDTWVNLAVLEATDLEGFTGETSYLAERLRIPLDVVDTALQTLTDVGLLRMQNGVLRKACRLLEFNSMKASDRLLAYHIQCLRHQIELLSSEGARHERERRLVTSLTVTTSKSHVAWAKQKLIETLREIADATGNFPAEDIYQLSIQFLPMTSPYESDAKNVGTL